VRLDPNPWTAGPPPTLTYVVERDDGVYAITAGEHPDGGRTITVEIRAEHDDEEIRIGMDTYSIWLEPPFASCWGGIAECVITGATLRILLMADATDALGVGPLLQFQLALDDAQHALLRTGLRRTLSSGRADRRPSRLDV
jgi:hypothetical protein